MRDAIEVFGVIVIGYFAVLNLLYIGFTGLAWRSITRYLHSLEYAAIDEALASPLTPPISILLPGYNEEAGIVQSVHALLQLRYPEFEVIVINDGSKDSTLQQLQEAFDLVEAPRALRGTVAHAPIRGTYRAPRHRELLVVDKENGGKADALNAGVDAARYPYVCAVDADAIIEPEALLRVAKPLLDDPDLVVATGGIVRIANGCTVEDGRVTEVRLPSSRLATLQVVEYFRAFLVGRVGWSQLHALLIISGAFGLFRRSTVEAVGGWAVLAIFGSFLGVGWGSASSLGAGGTASTLSERFPDEICDCKGLSSPKRRTTSPLAVSAPTIGVRRAESSGCGRAAMATPSASATPTTSQPCTSMQFSRFAARRGGVWIAATIADPMAAPSTPARPWAA